MVAADNSDDLAGTIDYEQQLADKIHHVRQIFQDQALPNIEVHRSSPQHFRQRAEFRVWHQDDDSYFVMFRAGKSSDAYRVDQLPSASVKINSLMGSLRECVLADPVLRRRLYQVEFLTSLSGEALITLIYHRKLDEGWQQAAVELGKALDAAIIGRSRGQRIVLNRDYVSEQFEIGDRVLTYRQDEGGFTQPNASMNQKMLNWADTVAAEIRGGDLLELYCGNGNFTLVLAPHFRHVLATEVAKVSVAAARHNLTTNGVDNVTLARLSSEEVATALAGKRQFRRLRDIDLGDLDISCVFVDPPRAGLDAATIDLVRKFPWILYVSSLFQSLNEPEIQG